ncbi:hypothetical protein [Mycobacterium yunnanensis]|uniref:hypothetical protein n=1 Tax=Mycobacterium yunnanensis TaxID=368477 RepID=UPI0021F38949|nr:hypothetical protein [Mycobacterium yunnanensis]
MGSNHAAVSLVRAVVVGRSSILGKPVGMLLLGRDAMVTYHQLNGSAEPVF